MINQVRFLHHFILPPPPHQPDRAAQHMLRKAMVAHVRLLSIPRCDRFARAPLARQFPIVNSREIAGLAAAHLHRCSYGKSRTANYRVPRSTASSSPRQTAWLQIHRCLTNLIQDNGCLRKKVEHFFVADRLEGERCVAAVSVHWPP